MPSSKPADMQPATRLGLLAVAAAVAVTVGLGVVLRLADPLSSPVLPAEDPYTHMALVREHLRTGQLEPVHERGDLYPPGLQAVLAVAWVYSGADLYDIVRFAPVVFGAIGILGMALLLWKTAGPVAGVVGALAMAVMPEAIFRTTMASPTALDLAILPFLAYALLRVVTGRLAWVGVAAPVAVFLAFSHPWLLAILCATGVVLLVSMVLVPWPASRGEPPSMAGIGLCVALLGGAFAVALTMPSFGGVFGLPQTTSLVWPAVAVAAASLAVGAVLFVVGQRGAGARDDLRAGGTQTMRARPNDVLPPLRASRPWFVRAALSLLIATTLLATALLVGQAGTPAFVDLPRMFGWPVLILASGALVALPFVASPVANLAASLVAATLPFVVFNPLRSDFLPHRTAVFLGVALCVLVGVAAAALVRGTRNLLALHTGRGRKAGTRGAAPLPHSSRRPGRVLLVLPAILVGTLLSGAVYAGTPDGYPGGWYRLYTPCELDALRTLARHADATPHAVVIVGDANAKLVLAALTSDAQRVWYKSEVFNSQADRDDLVAIMAHNGRPIIVVADRFLFTDTPDADLAFAQSPPWQPLGSWCAGMGIDQPRVVAFTTSGDWS